VEYRKVNGAYLYTLVMMKLFDAFKPLRNVCFFFSFNDNSGTLKCSRTPD